MFFKIKNSIISVPHNHLTQSSTTTRGHSLRYIQLAVRTNTYLNSFSQSAVRLWQFTHQWDVPSWGSDKSLSSAPGYFFHPHHSGHRLLQVAKP